MHYRARMIGHRWIIAAVGGSSVLVHHRRTDLRRGRDELPRRSVRGGPGNPHGADAAKLRAALMKEVKEGDVQAIIRKMIAKAKQGNVEAARLVFDRLFGKLDPPMNNPCGSGVYTESG